MKTPSTPENAAASCSAFAMSAIAMSQPIAAQSAALSRLRRTAANGLALANKMTGDLAADFAGNAGDCVHDFLLMIRCGDFLQLPPEAPRRF
jgi:hypothetical protein